VPKLLIPNDLLKRLNTEVSQAGENEIGGVMVGEHIGDCIFKLVNFSIQHEGGSACHFNRDPQMHHKFLNEFFEKTNHNYKRFNYLGEWHSHPSFPTTPSKADIKSMTELIMDPEQNATFAFLLICRSDSRDKMDIKATVFQPNKKMREAEITVINGNK